MSLSWSSCMFRCCIGLSGRNFRTLNRGILCLQKNSPVSAQANDLLRNAFLLRSRVDIAQRFQPLTTCFVLEHPFVRALSTAQCNYSSSSSSSSSSPPADSNVNKEEKLSLVQRYKKMLKEYWYVLIPVHVVTSAVWFGSFYYAAKSGIDIVPFLEQLGVSDRYLATLRNSSLGHIAVASAMYKLATPARYTVTLGGTTMTINYLSKRGILPSKDHLKQIMKDKKDSVVKKIRSKS